MLHLNIYGIALMMTSLYLWSYSKYYGNRIEPWLLSNMTNDLLWHFDRVGEEYVFFCGMFIRQESTLGWATEIYV